MCSSDLGAVGAAELVHLLVGDQHDALGRDPRLLHQRADRVELVEDLGVVAFDGYQLGHGKIVWPYGVDGRSEV